LLHAPLLPAAATVTAAADATAAPVFVAVIHQLYTTASACHSPLLFISTQLRLQSGWCPRALQLPEGRVVHLMGAMMAAGMVQALVAHYVTPLKCR